MLDNSILSVGTIFMLKCFNITTKEQLQKATLKVGDKPSFYTSVKVKQTHLEEINIFLGIQ